MSKYINAEWLLNFFEPYPNDYQTPLGLLRACVNDAPTIDAVEVVRCKDCNYFKRCDEAIWWCGKWGRHMADTEAKPTYCGWGKRDRP